jgi:hypothetical protein
LISRGLPRRNIQKQRLELRVVGVAILIILPGIAFAAGYFLRDYMSRQRRAEARRWRGYEQQPDWLTAKPPANTNETPPVPAVGELGQMLDRWESRARARRTG